LISSFIHFPDCHFELPSMKGALLTAAVLLGSAQAASHKLKLKKVPLAEQLVRPSSRAVTAGAC
jgi:hypothetical protein